MSVLQQRMASAGDRDALLAVFLAARPELAPLPPSLLALQFDAQQRQYRAFYPHAEDFLLLDGQQIAGRLYVARGERELHLLDIALLPPWRGQGHGARLIAALQDEARAMKVPLRLSVADGNPAARLYERLGFRQIATAPPYRALEWT
ncbi:MAG: GNAT family N-acetyltransferase, partial [Myxococcota bacterium]